ncbi:hypothetical protein [Neobacillus cucumis]|uniref:Uncharacterized protein n=1 Tax=Neobacillus cucumis TaxID=1740721 RepID=A0A2N5H8X0_9BACI|nr:hypothetical protein [Neobacillus cucumis]PLS01951.1 hypothetical protein CVD27_22825 [Neobacillus cucumis]
MCERDYFIFKWFNTSEQDENDAYFESECGEVDDRFTYRYTIGGQKEKENKKEKQQQQEAFQPNIENNPDVVNDEYAA